MSRTVAVRPHQHLHHNKTNCSLGRRSNIQTYFSITYTAPSAKNFWQIQAFWNLDVFPITLEVRQLDSKSVADHYIRLKNIFQSAIG